MRLLLVTRVSEELGKFDQRLGCSVEYSDVKKYTEIKEQLLPCAILRLQLL
jgi:hypothetical protein